MRNAPLPAFLRPMFIVAFSRRHIAVAGLAIVTAVAFASLIGSSNATAAPLPCGVIDPTTGRPIQAALTLDDQAAVTNRTLKRSTEEKTLSLVFSISGCNLYDPVRPPSILVVPAKGGDDLPDGALTLKGAAVDGSTLSSSSRSTRRRSTPGRTTAS